MSQGGVNGSNGGGGGLVTGLTPDQGGQVSAIGGNINVFGQTFGSVQAMHTINTANNFMIEDRTWQTAYVVDPSAAVGGRGTFSTIQAAVTAIIADGVATVSKWGVILVRPGTYTENPTIPGNVRIHIKGLTPEPNEALAPTGVLLNGIVTMTSTSQTLFENVGILALDMDVGDVRAYNSAVFALVGDGSASPGSVFFSAYGGEVKAVNITGIQFSAFNSDLIFDTVFAIDDAPVNSVLDGCTWLNGSANTLSLTGTTSIDIVNCRGMNISGDTSGTVSIQNTTLTNEINLPNATLQIGELAKDSSNPTLTELITQVPDIILPTSEGNIASRRVVTSSGDVTEDDQYVGCDHAADITLTLDPSVNFYKGQRITIADESGNAFTNQITVTPASGTINGGSSVVIAENYASLTLTFDGTDWYTSVYLTAGSKITTYNTSDSPATWTKDSRTLVVECFLWAGGGGGGSGRKGASTTSGGGGGGSAGGFAYYKGPSTFFNNTENVVIGAGGTGGNAQTATADGNFGNPGNNTTFGNMKALAGQFGLGGTNGTANGASGVLSGSFNVLGVAGSSGGNGRTTTGLAGANAGGAVSLQSNATGGGGGGGADTVTQRQGAIGGNNVDLGNTTVRAGGALGLESTGINGGNGNAPLSTGGIMSGGTGGGGGGGYSVGAGGATAGGTGGNGAVPGGGGGGGGGGITAVADSGAGGNGANGRVIVIEYF